MTPNPGLWPILNSVIYIRNLPIISLEDVGGFGPHTIAPPPLHPQMDFLDLPLIGKVMKYIHKH